MKPTLNNKTYRLKINGRRKTYHLNTNQKKAKIAILISGRAGLETGKISAVTKEMMK